MPKTDKLVEVTVRAWLDWCKLSVDASRRDASAAGFQIGVAHAEAQQHEILMDGLSRLRTRNTLDPDREDDVTS